MWRQWYEGLVKSFSSLRLFNLMSDEEFCFSRVCTTIHYYSQHDYQFHRDYLLGIRRPSCINHNYAMWRNLLSWLIPTLTTYMSWHPWARSVNMLAASTVISNDVQSSNNNQIRTKYLSNCIKKTSNPRQSLDQATTIPRGFCSFTLTFIFFLYAYNIERIV